MTIRITLARLFLTATRAVMDWAHSLHVKGLSLQVAAHEAEHLAAVVRTDAALLSRGVAQNAVRIATNLYNAARDEERQAMKALQNLTTAAQAEASKLGRSI